MVCRCDIRGDSTGPWNLGCSWDTGGHGDGVTQSQAGRGSTGGPRFVRDRVERCGDPQAVALSVAELGEPQPSSPDTKRLSECLRRIGDELDSNMELQRWALAAFWGSPWCPQACPDHPNRPLPQDDRAGGV